MVSLNVLTMCMYGYTHTDIYVHTHIYVMLEEKKIITRKKMNRLHRELFGEPQNRIKI